MTEMEYTRTDNLEVMAEAVNYNRFLLDLVERHADGARNVLDFGAGIGTFAADLARRGLGVRCVEADAAQAAVIEERGLPVVRDLADVEDGAADYVYSLNVLEHIENDNAALKLIRMKLRSGGVLLIYVPAFQVLFSSMDRKVGHFRRYRRRPLCDKVRAAGFEIQTARYVDSLGFLATLAFKAIGNDSGDINRQALITYDRYLFPLSRAGDLLFQNLLGKNLLVLARTR